ncbi:hypothetical protein XELAEV_18022755mg [Xenopus laevis]|uniref:Uncharacterized protein n=1 Tax=Xenopus laevis TaxID=8355 RepID=A0A974HNG5_XENLA|nr:hypothetical protein XELAEV_18022755mg [Xenopus laevis]
MNASLSPNKRDLDPGSTNRPKNSALIQKHYPPSFSNNHPFLLSCPLPRRLLAQIPAACEGALEKDCVQ